MFRVRGCRRYVCIAWHMDIQLLSAGDRELFSRYVSPIARPVSDMSFANLLMWRDVYDIRWGEWDNHLCVFSIGGEEPSLFFPPIGNGSPARALDACREVIRTCGHHRLAIEIVREEELDYLPGATLTPRSGDYVYETSRLISLEGRALSHKRQNRNAFVRKNPGIRIEPYRASLHRDACVELLERWNHRDSDDPEQEVCIKRKQETAAATCLLDFSEELALPGIVLFVGDQLIGVTIGESLTPDTFVSIIEKTDRQFAYSAQYIFSEFCARCWSHTKWCNACDDWEVPGLAHAKQSYDPAFRIPKWRAILPL